MAARGTKSKRPSAASSGSKPPEALVFFIDRSLGKKIVAQALREAGEKVEIHDDHFRPDAKDEVWLTEVGSRGWIVLTKDDRIRYRITERTALLSAKVTAFVLTSAQLQGREMADAFVKAILPIKRLIDKQRAPFLARVSRTGKVSLL
jgi:PIN domain-containing protein